MDEYSQGKDTEYDGYLKGIENGKDKKHDTDSVLVTERKGTRVSFESPCWPEDFSLDLHNVQLTPRALSPLEIIIDPTRSSDENTANKPVRRTIPTQKGREFELERLKDMRKGKLSNVTKQMNKIKPLLLDLSNERVVRMEVNYLNELFIKLQEAHEGYVKALEDRDEIDAANIWYDIHDRDVYTFKQDVIEFLNQAKELCGDKFETGSNRSQKSHCSRQSHASSSSKTKLIEAKARAASLEVKAAFLKEKQALRMASEELELRQELASAKVEEIIYEQYVEEDNDNFKGCFNEIKAKYTSTPMLNPVNHQSLGLQNSTCTVPTSAQPSIPNSQSDNISALKRSHYSAINESTSQEFLKVQQKQAELSEMIVTQQIRSSLPSHKPPVFFGDVMEYQPFMAAFETLIESKVEDSMERLYFLGQYTSGKAKEMIKGCLQMKSKDSYSVAKRLLKKHFGEPFKVSNAYIFKLSNWPTVKANDGTALLEFSIILQQARNAMSGMTYLNELNTAHVLRQLWEKLPLHLRSRWTEKASRIRRDKEIIAGFSDFCDFVSEKSDLANDPVYSERGAESFADVKGSRTANGKRPRGDKGTSFATNVHETTRSPVKPESQNCVLCNKPHSLDDCAEFLKKPFTDRKDFVKEKRLCYGCLGSNHISKFCRNRKTCKSCNKKHPTSLHDYSWKSEKKSLTNDGKGYKETVRSESQVTSACTAVCNVTEAGDVPINMGIVPVWLCHKNNPSKRVEVYALLDNASGGTFIKEETLLKLGLKGNETELLLTTMHGTEKITTNVVEGMVAVNFKYDNLSVDLPRAYVRKEIPANRAEIPRPEVVKEWPHLQRVSKELSPYMNNTEVGLLIGLNCPSAIRPREIIHGKENDPYAVRSLLGWHINGPINHLGTQGVQCNRIQVTTLNSSETKGYLVNERSVKEQFTPPMVAQMFELDFSEREKGKAISREDQEFLKKVNKGINHREDMHYEMPLPFRKDNVELPNNRPQAAHRLHSLKKKLKADNKYHNEYVSFMSDIIAKGYASKIEPEHLNGRQGKVWYLPHHGVYHPQKPGIVRVVFDCSARYQGESLNDHLLQGPDMTSNLIGVLSRFRQDNIAVMGDIEKMFYQVKVNYQDQDFLRFLWWPDSNIDCEPEEYRMTVHLFGGGSSPGCSNFALRRTADDYESEFGFEVADTLRRNFYVDDMLKSVATEDKAINLIQDVQGICGKGGFSLTKFVSNSRKVIASISEEHRAKDIKGLDLGQDKLPVERALGVQWSVELDAFTFRIELKDNPCTRRGILATISSVYDPLGFIAPVILVGKRILQDICQGGSWDDPVPDDILGRWVKWRSELFILEKLNVPRGFKPPNFGRISSVELHNMSDASQIGYGQCSYLRITNENGQVHCAFVMGKARVAPKKTVSIPRLELMAATISVKIAEVLKEELDFTQMKEVYWTDSKVVIGFINNESRRFHVYVANRVQLIRDHTSPSQWRYVDSASNPADEASRGLSAKNFVQKSQWINGPDFLWKTEDFWPKQESYKGEINLDGPEVKKVITHAIVTHERNNMLSRFDRFSNWYRLKAAVAICMMYKRKLKMRIGQPKDISEGWKQDCHPRNLAVTNLEHAEIEIIKLIQANAFGQEIEDIRGFERQGKYENRESEKKKKLVLKKTSSLHKLDPFLDVNGILRVGGRIRKANVVDQLKHPIILPRTNLTRLIIKDVHEKTQHSGRGITLNELRSRGYWMVGGNSEVRRYLSKCVTCRHLRGATGEQKMADLPQSRIEPAPPFTHSGVDCFGPWYVKQGRKEVKRYGALFTCMASRAVHIEVVHSMETDSFIQALRRFICRRGAVRDLRSDQGTNFIGAENELNKALEEMEDDKIKAELLQHNIDWYKNPATASNFGGVWERQIRSIRSILNALMREHGHSLDDESLHTIMCEAEAIINSRPLTVECLSDPFSALPLTPNALLTGKSKLILPPPGKFQSEDVYSRRRWRRVQHLSNDFWNRWKKEYMQNLQMRHKWTTQRRNFSVGDVVLLKEANTPRNKWNMAKVLQAHCDDLEMVRSVTVQTANGSKLDRPINKLVLLLEANQ